MTPKVIGTIWAVFLIGTILGGLGKENPSYVVNAGMVFTGIGIFLPFLICLWW